MIEKFEKYLNYYELCGEGRAALLSAAEAICADRALLADALLLKDKLADPSQSFDPGAEFKDRSGQFCAFVFTLAIESMEKFYMEKNIPRDIFLDTINDLAVWINRNHEWYGEWGFTQPGWIMHHIRGNLFKLGRLQFEISKVGEWSRPPEELNLGIKLGDSVLGVHIPRGGKLGEAECLDSFERAKIFFPKYFGYNFKAFCCFTWLFDPAFVNMLPPESNILKFQNLFVRYPGHESYGGLDYVFVNITKDNIADAPTDTLFRKKLVEHLTAGGIMQTGCGYRIV